MIAYRRPVIHLFSVTVTADQEFVLLLRIQILST